MVGILAHGPRSALDDADLRHPVLVGCETTRPQGLPARVVDFAAEATELAKNQILAQSGTAMLAQASAVSQNVLGLLM